MATDLTRVSLARVLDMRSEMMLNSGTGLSNQRRGPSVGRFSLSGDIELTRFVLRNQLWPDRAPGARKALQLCLAELVDESITYAT